MIRYWAFAAFALVLASRARGGIAGTARSRSPWLQLSRGTLLAVQIVLAITCFAVIGLARTQAIFAATPLIATVMSVVILGERASRLRWFAVFLGFCGVLLILKPHGDFFDATVLLAVLCSVMFASYSVMTRMAGCFDQPLTSFFYTGVAGCAVICMIGPFHWTNMTPGDWGWMATLCLTSVTSHYLLIKAYNILDATAVQPLSYLSVVYASIMGPVVFHETVHLSTYVGAAIVVAGGLLSIWSERRHRS
jgi:drug/metabolite transporter (DMT)-like permease